MPKKTLYLFLFSLLFSASVSAQEKEPQKIDEFGSINCETYLVKRDYLRILANDNPSSTIYVLVYDGKESKYNERTKKYELIFPTLGSAKAKINSIKKSLLFVKMPLDRFKFVEAGFREELTVEFWLVPVGAKPPVPAPTLTKMKYRKGKTWTYCYTCCGP